MKQIHDTVSNQKMRHEYTMTSALNIVYGLWTHVRILSALTKMLEGMKKVHRKNDEIRKWMGMFTEQMREL